MTDERPVSAAAAEPSAGHDWAWSVFGTNKDGIDYIIVYGARRPPLWKRLIMRFLLGSTWEREK